MNKREIQDRVGRGVGIFKRGGVRADPVRFIPYTVEGDEGKYYSVRFYPEDGKDEWTCECPDHRERGMTCKHIWAAMMFRRLD